MILRRFPRQKSHLLRTFTTTFHPSTASSAVPNTRTLNPSTSSATVAQPFTTPHPMPPPLASKKATPTTPASSCVAGTTLRGLNYIKGHEDPVALPDDEYPAWLWKCLDKKVDADDEGEAGVDEFAKSAKTRKKAAKAKRALEELRRTGAVAPAEVKIPLQRQSIDLPSEGPAAAAARDDLRLAMRKERRKTIKEGNYLKTL